MASKLPGWKTRLTLIAGFVASAAAFMQDQLSFLNLNSKEMAIAGLVLFSLAYWFRRLADKE